MEGKPPTNQMFNELVEEVQQLREELDDLKSEFEDHEHEFDGTTSRP